MLAQLERRIVSSLGNSTQVWGQRCASPCKEPLVLLPKPQFEDSWARETTEVGPPSVQTCWKQYLRRAIVTKLGRGQGTEDSDKLTSSKEKPSPTAISRNPDTSSLSL
eukprot:scaffold7625_cov277-Pinguiococcus_pyrenoidosus.AAC.10